MVGHETLEAYDSAVNQTTMSNMSNSHYFANGFFAGIQPVANQSSAHFTVINGAITHVSSVFNIQGTNTNIRIERQFVTPIPVNSVVNSVPPHHIVDVRREP